VGVLFNSLAVLVFCLRVTSKLTGSAGSFGVDDFVMGAVIVSPPTSSVAKS
jgi:hypothetical protein